MWSECFSLKFFQAFFLPCIRLVGIQVTINLPFLISLYYIGRIGTSVSIDAFGLSVTFFSMTFTSILLGAQEQIGLKGAQYFAAGKNEKLIKIFWKSIYFSVFISFVYFVLTIYSFRILIFFNIQEVVARATSALLICTNPYLFFQGINQITQNYLSAQKITKPFTYMNVMAVVLILILARVFIIDLDYKEIGFAIAAGIQEFANFVYLFVYLGRNIKDFNYKPHFFNNLGKIKYIGTCFLTSLSFYGAFVAYECNTYYVALLHDPDQLASWIASTYPMSIFYFFNIGISFNIRNFIGHLIGEKDFKTARRHTKIYFFYIFVLSLLINVLQVVFRYEIARLFTANVKIQNLVAFNIILMTLHIFPTLMMYSLNSVLRLLDHDNFQFYCNVLLYPIMIIIVSYIFCFVLNLGVMGIILGFGLSRFVFILILLIKIFCFVDWKKMILNKKYSETENLSYDIDVEDEEEKKKLIN